MIRLWFCNCKENFLCLLGSLYARNEMMKQLHLNNNNFVYNIDMQLLIEFSNYIQIEHLVSDIFIVKRIKIP